MPVSSSLLAPLPMINLSPLPSAFPIGTGGGIGAPSSPTKVPSPLPVSSSISSLVGAQLAGTQSPSAASGIQLSMIGLPPVPASPSKSKSPVAVSSGTLSSGASTVPLVGGSAIVNKAEQSIHDSLTKLQASPVLKSSPSLERLGSFSQLPKIEHSPTVGSLMNVPDSNLKPLSSKPTTVDKTETTATFHDHKGMIHDTSVEQMLTKSGYLPVDKILTKDENNNLMCQYIKAVDPTGRTTFVDLDCEGYVAVDPKDMTMAHSSKASVLPYSTKMGTYECASSDVCGVAFECDNEICTLKRNNESLTPSEAVFTSSRIDERASGHKEHGMLSNQPIAYPIVSLSDIKENPEKVACSIRDSHNRMRNVSFSQANFQTTNLVDATTALNNEVYWFSASQRMNAGKLTTTIEQLETAHETMKRKPPVTDKGRANLRSVRYNLRRRHDLVVDHLKLSEAVNSRINRVRELLGEIKTLNDFGDRLFEGLEYEYQE